MSVELLTPAKAAEKYPTLGNADWFRNQLRKGTLRGSKVGRWQITEESILEMLEAATNIPARKRRRRAS